MDFLEVEAREGGHANLHPPNCPDGMVKCKQFAGAGGWGAYGVLSEDLGYFEEFFKPQLYFNLREYFRRKMLTSKFLLGSLTSSDPPNWQ